MRVCLHAFVFEKANVDMVVQLMFTQVMVLSARFMCDLQHGSASLHGHVYKTSCGLDSSATAGIKFTLQHTINS
jgi:hypothetical protein